MCVSSWLIVVVLNISSSCHSSSSSRIAIDSVEPPVSSASPQAKLTVTCMVTTGHAHGTRSLLIVVPQQTQLYNTNKVKKNTADI